MTRPDTKKALAQDEVEPVGQSKSEVKREFKDLQTLVEQLLLLSGKQLACMPLPPALQQDILATKKMKNAARKREVQRLGGLLFEQTDTQQLTLAYEQRDQPSLITADVLLVQTPNQAAMIKRLVHAGMARTKLERLMRHASKEQASGLPQGPAYQALEQLLRDTPAT